MRKTEPTPDPSRLDDALRRREEYIIYMLGNDLKARLWWAWLEKEAERRGYK